jgi:hypothetical protein
MKERPILFRRYTTLHLLVLSAALAVAAAMTGVSAGRHNTAKNDCLQDFFATNTTSSTSSLGNTECEIFPWVDVGIMGGLCLLLAISQVGSSQPSIPCTLLKPISVDILCCYSVWIQQLPA